MGGAFSVHGGDEKCVQNFGRKPGEKRPLERTRLRWKYNNKMQLK
jgi:hypothetical protein